MTQQIYPLYNQDYQNYKQRFNKGLNFRVFSKNKTIQDKFYKGFYIVKVPDDEASMAYFRVEIWMKIYLYGSFTYPLLFLSFILFMPLLIKGF